MRVGIHRDDPSSVASSCRYASTENAASTGDEEEEEEEEKEEEELAGQEDEEEDEEEEEEGANALRLCELWGSPSTSTWYFPPTRGRFFRGSSRPLNSKTSSHCAFGRPDRDILVTHRILVPALEGEGGEERNQASTLILQASPKSEMRTPSPGSRVFCRGMARD
jgi:hypothetical protein